MRSGGHLSRRVSPEPYPPLLRRLADLAHPLAGAPAPNAAVDWVAGLLELFPAGALLRVAGGQDHLLVGVDVAVCVYICFLGIRHERGEAEEIWWVGANVAGAGKEVLEPSLRHVNGGLLTGRILARTEESRTDGPGDELRGRRAIEGLELIARWGWWCARTGRRRHCWTRGISGALLLGVSPEEEGSRRSAAATAARGGAVAGGGEEG
ncbi:FORKED 1 [Striga asiatica]|uniref:FORKED 1 n=1 Tax=Striga asiatica TaxID=4170 RepID=A0A5A7PP49_STRAF|nr:FORKED 1 [Striga asiatica]